MVNLPGIKGMNVMMDGQYWNMHWGMGWGNWFLFLLVCLAIYLIFRNNVQIPGKGNEDTPMDILKKRYAKGEITREEFEEMKKELV